MKKFFVPILALLLSLIPLTYIHASSTDFVIDTNTQISYTTGQDYVTVKNTYTREVKNSSFYYPASGEKSFHIPDIQNNSQEQIALERKFKKNSISVTDTSGRSVKYTLKEEKSTQGMYVNVNNYKSTTVNSPYSIIFTYKTHDYITKIGTFVTIQAPALPKDIVFEQTEKSSKTTTQYNYGLDIVVDKKITQLAKVYPSQFIQEDTAKSTTYSFNQVDRIENSPYLEFGTKATYKFELIFKTPKTDNFIPEKYSDIYSPISTNIYEISLPREYGETNQQVFFSKVEPLPKNIYQDSEGNLIAVFEVPANQDSEISIDGYITVEQDEYTKDGNSFDMSLESYLQEISKSPFVSKYLTPSKYWESNDVYIKQEADRIIGLQTTILGVIKEDYAFVNDKLEYDYDKANSENLRIGAKAALMGGASVCMEYSDSMIAILRAQGIPSRAAGGYANLVETIVDNPTTHQWVQVWIPSYGWLTVDPTLESKNMLIGKTIDRILWETFNGDSLSNIRVYSANDITAVSNSGYNIKVYGVNDFGDDEKTLKRYIDLMPEKGYTDTEQIPINSNYSLPHWFNTFLKTTTIGKSILISGPILLILAFLTGVILAISIIAKTIKRKSINKH